MGLDGKEAEIWNPQPNTQNTEDEKQEEAKKVKREAHTHNHIHFRSKVPRHTFINQTDMHRSIRERPRLSGAPHIGSPK